METDPYQRMGGLNDEMLRAMRLVVDTGIHAMHWTRQQAIDYGIEVSEVERYVMNPGQACSYMLGELKLLLASACEAIHQRIHSLAGQH